MAYESLRRPQFFYTTTPSPCPYLSGRTERKLVTELSGPEAESLHNDLSHAGFRRNHAIAYAPVCPACRACVPIRIPAACFQRRRALARTWKLNAAMTGAQAPACATMEHYQLFARYQQARHLDGDMAAMRFHDFRAMIDETPIDTVLAEFRDPMANLVGACLTDRLSDGYSAVYSYFAPELEHRSLGTFMILWLLEEARRRDLPYVYLGYWVQGSRKMAYKARFRPCEILENGVWRCLDEE